MGSVDERKYRRQVRRAMQTRDVSLLHLLLTRGADVNKPLSDVLPETPLTFAIKHGYLEIVEVLLRLVEREHTETNQIRLKCGRITCSPLDIAIKCWLDCHLVGTKDKPDLSRRYRILRLILASGHYVINQHLLSDLLNKMVDEDRSSSVRKLVTVVCHHGGDTDRSCLLVALMTFSGSVQDLASLLDSGADPRLLCTTAVMATPCIPLHNAILLVRASNDGKFLTRIEALTRHYTHHTEENTVRLYQFLLRLLTVCGHRLELCQLNQLYRCQVRMYKWTILHTSSPLSLGNLARIALRRRLSPNVICACAKWTSLPESLRDSITFECWLYGVYK